MTRERLAFIDWMKALGILLIVLGHVAGGPINELCAPIYPKQLGVAFFVFVMGFGLARENRPIREVLVARLFDVYVLGTIAALVTTAWYWSTVGDLAESNYLPLLGGLHVLENAFPLNPTTWFIGTYLHLLLIWAVFLRRLEVTAAMLAALVVIEIAVRAAVMQTAGPYVAYMLAPNWLSVFLMGRFVAQRWPIANGGGRRWVSVCLATSLTVLGVMLGRSSSLDVPFMRLGGDSASLVWTSVAVSGMYLGWTGACFLWIRQAEVPAVVRVVARNTVFVFIVHMPLFFALDGLVRERFPGYPMRAAILMMACMVLPVLVSELIRPHLQQLRHAMTTRRIVRPETTPA